MLYCVIELNIRDKIVIRHIIFYEVWKICWSENEYLFKVVSK